MVITSARLLGALIKVLPSEAAAPLIKYVVLALFPFFKLLIGCSRGRVLTTHLSKPSVLALNAVLLDAPDALAGQFPEETVAILCQGIAHRVSCDLFYIFGTVFSSCTRTRLSQTILFSLQVNISLRSPARSPLRSQNQYSKLWRR